MATRKKTEVQTMFNRTLHRQLNIEQHELHTKLGVNRGVPEV